MREVLSGRGLVENQRGSRCEWVLGFARTAVMRAGSNTTAPSPSATRSGKTYTTANSAKSRYKPGFDVHEGKEIDIKGYLSIGNEDLHAGGVILQES